MAAPARADLELLLRARKLDRTLVQARVASDPIPTGLADLDRTLGGGLPCGELSEIVGQRSSGRTTVAFGTLRSAIAGRGLAALVDAFDRFDPESAAVMLSDRRGSVAGLERLLWVRGETGSVETAIDPGPALERAVKAFNLVLQAGGFAVAALDLADAPSAALRRLPFTTWFRLARAIEGGRTVALVIAAEHLARSPGGVTIAMEAAPQWQGTTARGRLFTGISLRPQLRNQATGEQPTAKKVASEDRLRPTHQELRTNREGDCLPVS
ncbi:MAG: hypothetical protein ACRD09_15815 [Vicinamibacterales bacterium]